VVPGAHGQDEYALTGKGADLWPVVRSLLVWGDEHYCEAGPRRVFRHAGDNGEVLPDGVCDACGDIVGSADLVVAPAPGWRISRPRRTRSRSRSTSRTACSNRSVK
jgi:hypothetical protein